MPNNKFKEEILKALKQYSGFEIPEAVFDEKIKNPEFKKDVLKALKNDAGFDIPEEDFNKELGIGVNNIQSETLNRNLQDAITPTQEQEVQPLSQSKFKERDYIIIFGGVIITFLSFLLIRKNKIRKNKETEIDSNKLRDNELESSNLYEQGMKYFEGRTVLKDTSKALDYLKQSAKLNSILAQYQIGLFYLGESNLKEAAFWLEKSFYGGYEPAQELWNKHELWRHKSPNLNSSNLVIKGVHYLKPYFLKLLIPLCVLLVLIVLNPNERDFGIYMGANSFEENIYFTSKIKRQNYYIFSVFESENGTYIGCMKMFFAKEK